MRLSESREAVKTLGLEVNPKAKKTGLVAVIRSATGPVWRGCPPKNRTEIKVRCETPKIKTGAAKPASSEANPLVGRVNTALASAGVNAAKGGDAGALVGAKSAKEKKKIRASIPFEWPVARDAYNPSGSGDNSNGRDNSNGGDNSNDNVQDRNDAKMTGQDGLKPENRSDDRSSQGSDRGSRGSDHSAQGA